MIKQKMVLLSFLSATLAMQSLSFATSLDKDHLGLNIEYVKQLAHRTILTEEQSSQEIKNLAFVQINYYKEFLNNVNDDENCEKMLINTLLGPDLFKREKPDNLDVIFYKRFDASFSDLKISTLLSLSYNLVSWESIHTLATKRNWVELMNTLLNLRQTYNKLIYTATENVLNAFNLPAHSESIDNFCFSHMLQQKEKMELVKILDHNTLRDALVSNFHVTELNNLLDLIPYCWNHLSSEYIHDLVTFPSCILVKKSPDPLYALLPPPSNTNEEGIKIIKGNNALSNTNEEGIKIIKGNNALFMNVVIDSIEYTIPSNIVKISIETIPILKALRDEIAQYPVFHSSIDLGRMKKRYALPNTPQKTNAKEDIFLMNNRVIIPPKEKRTLVCEKYLNSLTQMLERPYQINFSLPSGYHLIHTNLDEQAAKTGFQTIENNLAQQKRQHKKADSLTDRADDGFESFTNRQPNQKAQNKRGKQVKQQKKKLLKSTRSKPLEPQKAMISQNQDTITTTITDAHAPESKPSTLLTRQTTMISEKEQEKDGGTHLANANNKLVFEDAQSTSDTPQNVQSPLPNSVTLSTQTPLESQNEMIAQNQDTITTTITDAHAPESKPSTLLTRQTTMISEKEQDGEHHLANIKNTLAFEDVQATSYTPQNMQAPSPIPSSLMTMTTTSTPFQSNVLEIESPIHKRKTHRISINPSVIPFLGNPDINILCCLYFYPTHLHSYFRWQDFKNLIAHLGGKTDVVRGTAIISFPNFTSHNKFNVHPPHGANGWLYDKGFADFATSGLSRIFKIEKL